MKAYEARLGALADLLAAGRSPAAALAVLGHVGGEAGAWARGVAGSVNSGVELGLALTRALPPEVIDALGGPASAGDPTVLRYVLAQRRRRRARLRALWASLLMPAFFVVLTSVSIRGLLVMLGGAASSALLDLAPLVGLALLIGLGQRVARPQWILGVPLLGRLAWLEAEAAVAIALAAGPPARALEVARDRFGPPLVATFGPVIQRLRAGASLAEGGPPSSAVGEALALEIVAGAAAGDLEARMRRHAEAATETVTTALRWLVRIAAWGVLAWVSLRATADLASIDLGGLPGLGGLEGLDGLEGSPEMEELMRELDL